jgi:hypothetical protein
MPFKLEKKFEPASMKTKKKEKKVCQSRFSIYFIKLKNCRDDINEIKGDFTMKLKHKLSMAALFVIVGSSSLTAAVNEDYNSDYTASRKLGRGVANVITGVVEIPKAVY